MGLDFIMKVAMCR